MAAPMIRLADVGATFVPGEMSWPFPERLAVGRTADGFWVAEPSKLGQTWPVGTRLYRKARESQLGPEVDAMEHVFRGAEYQRLTDVEMYEWRLPAIRWREPIEVVVEDGPRHDVLGPAPRGFFCRVCIAREGLNAAQVQERAMSEGDAIAHIEREHCSLPKEGEG